MLRFSRKSGKEPVNMAVELHPLTLSRAAAETSKLPTLAAIAATVAVLYIARDVFLPLAIAILLTFALAPVVSRLRRAGCPRSVAVIGTVTMAFLFLSAFGAMVALQISEVARDVPRYQSNIVEKVRSLKEAGSDSQILDRLSRVMERISIELSRPEKDVADRA